MISMDKSFDLNPIINGIEIFKKEFSQYYNCLSAYELQPYKIVIESNLIIKKSDLVEKIILLYSDKLIILKKIDDSVSKHILEYADINYIINEGMPNPSSIVIEYGSGEKEKIIYASKAASIVNSLLCDLRRFIVAKAEDQNVENKSDAVLQALEENKYIGASIAKRALLDKSVIICSLKQRKVFDRAWWVLRKTVTQNHFSIICNNEIIIFIEKCNSKRQWSVIGDLIFIPIKALKSTSIEATGKGMILRYLFYSGRKYEVFYENEKTDDLLKVMVFLNGSIASVK